MTNDGEYHIHKCSGINFSKLSQTEIKSWCYYHTLYHIICPIRTTLFEYVDDQEYMSTLDQQLKNISHSCEINLDQSISQHNTQSPSLSPSSIPSTLSPTSDPTIRRFENLYYSNVSF